MCSPKIWEYTGLGYRLYLNLKMLGFKINCHVDGVPPSRG